MRVGRGSGQPRVRVVHGRRAPGRCNGRRPRARSRRPAAGHSVALRRRPASADTVPRPRRRRRSSTVRALAGDHQPRTEVRVSDRWLRRRVARSPRRLLRRSTGTGGCDGRDGRRRRPHRSAARRRGAGPGSRFLGLLWASEGSIIGSGWLFGALDAAAIAGPSAIIGWVARLADHHRPGPRARRAGRAVPGQRRTSRFPHYAFGSFAGATFGWASYLQAASVAPIEVLAAIQYLSTSHWARNFFVTTWSRAPAAP